LAQSPWLHPAIYFDHFFIGTYFDWMFALSGGPTGILLPDFALLQDVYFCKEK
jgi:hypothetical protein